MMASRASLTQSGHSESVVRGQPSVGLDFSHDFSSGLSDHLGVKDGLGLYLLKNWTVLNVAPATLQSDQSNVFQSLLLTLFGIFAFPLKLLLGINATPKLYPCNPFEFQVPRIVRGP